MRKWEVRKVSGKGFLHDTPVRTYDNLEQTEVDTLKRVHNVRYLGEMMDFVNVDHLVARGPSGNLTEEDVDALPTSWKGEALPQGSVYCLVLDTDELAAANPAGGESAVKRAFQQKIEDKVVLAEGQKLFKAGGVAEAQKNVAQAEKAEGGVWGARRKGPARF